MTFDDEFVPNETCDICGGHAGFESSPEGSRCSVCDLLVCDDHVSYRYMRKLYEDSGGEYEGTDPICTECEEEGRIPREYPVVM